MAQPTLVLFKEIPAEDINIPHTGEITREVQVAACVKLGLPTNMADKIVKIPILSMPGFPICMYFTKWYCDKLEAKSTGMNIPYGVCCSNIEDWKRDNGEQATKDLLTSLINKGYPTVHWMWHIGPEQDTRRPRGHSPAARAA